MLSRHCVLASLALFLSLLACLFYSSKWLLRGSSASKGMAPERELLSQSELLPAVYLNYDNPTSELKKTWFSSVKVHDSQDSTFYAVQRTQFGYLGIQHDSTYWGGLEHSLGLHLNENVVEEWAGIVIFSIWDIEDCTGIACSHSERCQVVEVGEGAYDNSFGGEGTGCQIKFPTAWGKAEYHFASTVKDVGNDRLRFTSYWQDATDKGGPWKIIGAIIVKKNGRNLGEGGLSSFIEQYRSIRSSEVRVAKFGDQFMETLSGQWVPIVSATFRATASPIKSDHIAAITGSDFNLGVAGSEALHGYTPDGIHLRLPSTPSMMSTAPHLQEWIQLRDSGNLPQGCYEGSCTFLENWRQFRRSIVEPLCPGSPDKVFMLLLTIGIIAAMVWTLKHCCKPRNRAGFSGPERSTSRGLIAS